VRWRSLADAVSDGAIVDRDDTRAQLRSVAFVAPIQEGRTFWHGRYDVDDATAELTYYLHDVDGHSVYSDPIRFELRS
jgi:hypothetical protein